MARKGVKKIRSAEKLDIRKLLVSVLICESVGVAGSLFTVVSLSSWYNALNKPFFAPPNWMFAPLWVILYFLMGIAGYLIWKSVKSNPKARIALILFTLQLMLNFSWTAIFFGQRLAVGGLVVISMLWVVLLATIIAFYRVAWRPAVLLMPYFIWVIFAMVVNIYIVLLNA